MTRPRTLITPAVFLSASIVAGSGADEAVEPRADAPHRARQPGSGSTTSGIHGMLARAAHVCHTR